MRLKIIAYDHSVKGLDIDLKLEEPSRKKVNSILKTLNSVIEREESLAAIPDEAEVVRINLFNADQEEIKKFKEKLKYSNREDIFLFLSKEDDLLAVIKDYNILETADYTYFDKNTNDFIRESHYALRISAEEPTKTRYKRVQRSEQRRNSPNVQRERTIRSRQEILDKQIKKLIEKLKIYYKKSNVVENQSLFPSRPTLETKGRKRVIDLNPGDTFQRDNKTSYGQIISVTQTEEGVVSVEFNVMDLSTGEIIEKLSGNSRADYEVIMVEIIPPKENSELEEYYEEILPEKIDWEKMIRTGQKFPGNLFLDATDVLRKDLKSEWDAVRRIVTDESRSIVESEKRQQFKNNLRGYNTGSLNSESMSFMDKSGYSVNLKKYFQKLLEIPPKVPNEVKETYEEIHKKVTEISSYAVKELQKLAEKENWTEIGQISSSLTNFNPKNFNERYKDLLDEEIYKRGTRIYTSKSEAIARMEKYLENLPEPISKILPQEIEINLN